MTSNPNGAAFTKESVKEIRQAIDEALATISAKYGCKIKTAKTLTYDAGSFHVRVEGSAGEGGVDGARREWELYAAMYDLPVDGFGKRFTTYLPGDAYEVVGIQPRRQKNTVLVKKLSSGKNFLMPAAQVAHFLSRVAS